MRQACWRYRTRRSTVNVAACYLIQSYHVRSFNGVRLVASAYQRAEEARAIAHDGCARIRVATSVRPVQLIVHSLLLLRIRGRFASHIGRVGNRASPTAIFQ